MALVNNQAALNTVYNYFLTTYAPTTNSTSRYDTHKKSELRSVYNSIIKQSKESPTYIIDTSQETKAFAVGMKEGARQFSNMISSLSSGEDGDVLSRRVASSSDDAIASAKYIGEANGGNDDISFDIEVDKLALSQINEGKFLRDDEPVGLESGTYSFDIHVNGSDYEFQFGIGEEDTNSDLIHKLESLINRSNIGVMAEVEENDGRSSLKLESSATGLMPGQTSIFRVSDDSTSKTRGAVEYLGIGDVTRAPSNAQFKLNGVERTAFANTFTVDKQFEISLKGESQPGEKATIGLKPDVESMSDNIHQLVRGYNDFVDRAKEYSGKNVRTDTFMTDLWRTNINYKSSLEKMGITFDDEGRLAVDDDRLKSRLDSNDTKNEMNTIKDFTSALVRKTGQISLDPMNYVQKTVVAYKNPGKSFSNPYVTSIYSGMMFNSYC